MKTFKKIASLVIAATMITSSVAFVSSASAATVQDDYATQSNVQDGVILHAFNWSYNAIKDNLPAIAAAGYSTVQTSPVQQPKDYVTSNDVVQQWWKLYQPVSMSIAKNTWLGTKDELKSLCAEADKYGIKIICDIVSNHMGNETESNPSSLSSQVNTYQPDFYANKDTYFHDYKPAANDNSIQGVVQGHLSSCPDLNTGNKNVQNAVVNLLKECIDCGVDGFRFDAAKHIETPKDGDYASDYWPTITSEAKNYYKQKTGNDLYIYGEILNTCGTGRVFSSYTDYINITDNATGDNLLSNVKNKNAANAAKASYATGQKPEKLVLWAESHDTYEGSSGNSASVSNENIIKTWAIAASRKDATALYFPRPGSAKMGDAATDVTYKSTAVSEINKFHNLSVGKSEKLGASNGVVYVARGTDGVVLSNVGGASDTVSISNTGVKDGTYTDTISGNKFTVSGGVLKGTIGSTGVAVVYNGTTTPRNTNTVESCTFEGDTLTLTLGLDNAVSGTYALDDSATAAYTGTTTIRIGSDYKYGDKITLNLTATDGSKTTKTSYTYVKKEAASSGVYLFFKAETKKFWSAPYNVYIYDEDTDKASKGLTYKNASWPGQAMQFDEASGYYYLEVSDNTCLAEDANKNVSQSSFDLAHSANTYVIFNESKNGLQYPPDGSKTKLALGGKSKGYCLTKADSFEDTDLVPSASAQEPATDVTKGDNETTLPPATENYFYGDVDLSGNISIVDVTQLQKIIAGLASISDEYKAIADVDSDGSAGIKDATLIQKYLAGYTDVALVGTPFNKNVPPTTKPQEPTEDATEESTSPSNTYTFYFKTTLSWMTDLGCDPYVYDEATGVSYKLLRDENAYPNVYVAEVPDTLAACTIYRSLAPVDHKPVVDGTSVYNAWSGTVSKENNCFTLDGSEKITVGPYVEEEEPTFALDRVYYDNSKSKWTNVYIYGWAESGLENNQQAMTQIVGTDIWYYDFDKSLMPGATCFLFKNDFKGTDTWDKQSANVTVKDGMNCYVGSASNKGSGTWTVYNG